LKGTFGFPSRQIVAQIRQRSGPTRRTTFATLARNASTEPGVSLVPRLITT
jgi:hypothetical protein